MAPCYRQGACDWMGAGKGKGPVGSVCAADRSGQVHTELAPGVCGRGTVGAGSIQVLETSRGVKGSRAEVVVEHADFEGG